MSPFHPELVVRLTWMARGLSYPHWSQTSPPCSCHHPQRGPGTASYSPSCPTRAENPSQDCGTEGWEPESPVNSLPSLPQCLHFQSELPPWWQTQEEGCPVKEGLGRGGVCRVRVTVQLTHGHSISEQLQAGELPDPSSSCSLTFCLLSLQTSSSPCTHRR